MLASIKISPLDENVNTMNDTLASAIFESAEKCNMTYTQKNTNSHYSKRKNQPWSDSECLNYKKDLDKHLNLCKKIISTLIF